MKHLRAVHTLPYAAPSGRIITRPGHDSETQVYLHLPRDYTPHIPSAPTDAQLKDATVTLMGPWSGYRFATPDDAAGMVSAVLSAVFRPALNLCPGYMLEAACQASGKTLAATALGCLLTGQRVGVVPFAGDGGSDDEMRKRLVSHAAAQDRFMCIDNVVGYWKSAALSGVLTSGRIVDRLLGASRIVDAEVNMLITATGNNAMLDADLLRRMVRVRVDSGSNPAARRFPFVPTERALHERLKIAEAACTLLAGYWAAGSPRIAADDAGGFGAFTALCRQPVLWLAERGLTDVLGWGPLGDPAASLLADASSLDPDIEALGDLLRSLNALSDGKHFDSKAVQGWFVMGSGSPTDGGPCEQLHEAVTEILGSRATRDAPSSRTLGRLLINRRDRVVQGLKLVACGSVGYSRSWRVAHVS